MYNYPIRPKGKVPFPLFIVIIYHVQKQQGVCVCVFPHQMVPTMSLLLLAPCFEQDLVQYNTSKLQYVGASQSKAKQKESRGQGFFLGGGVLMNCPALSSSVILGEGRGREAGI